MYVCPECGSPLKAKLKYCKIEEFDIDYRGTTEITKAKYINTIDVYCASNISHNIPNEVQHSVRYLIDTNKK